mmetsp:Transcript_49773/g.79356  ORF Transcript_49773/g.79356 Transcript_49773/m.79356 type:complete len:101 (+) Transcript_49773:606-908(+)
MEAAELMLIWEHALDDEQVSCNRSALDASMVVSEQPESVLQLTVHNDLLHRMVLPLSETEAESYCSSPVLLEEGDTMAAYDARCVIRRRMPVRNSMIEEV